MTHNNTDTPNTASGGPSLGPSPWRGRIQRSVTRLRDRRWIIALVAGLLGALAALLVMGLLRLWWGTLTPPELFGERLLPLIPADQFVALLARFKEMASARWLAVNSDRARLDGRLRPRARQVGEKLRQRAVQPLADEVIADRNYRRGGGRRGTIIGR